MSSPPERDAAIALENARRTIDPLDIHAGLLQAIDRHPVRTQRPDIRICRKSRGSAACGKASDSADANALRVTGPLRRSGSFARRPDQKDKRMTGRSGDRRAISMNPAPAKVEA
jgi:hypothetical protein